MQGRIVLPNPMIPNRCLAFVCIIVLVINQEFYVVFLLFLYYYYNTENPRI